MVYRVYRCRALLGFGVLYFEVFVGSGFRLWLLIPKKYIPGFFRVYSKVRFKAEALKPAP